jgi:DNA-binding NarL/FixJ family response regulator
MTGPMRVLVTDDQRIVGDGLAMLLGLLPDVEVAGTADNGHEAVAMSARLRPDIVLMDLRMPRSDGVEATRLLREQQPDVAVVVLTTYEDDRSVLDPLCAGARGYLTKDASREDIAVAIRAVARGQATFDPAVSARLLAGLGSGVGQEDSPDRSEARPSDPRLAELTGREREVLRLIGDGLTNPEIADHLYVSTSTVKTHINNMFAKLQLRDRAHAVRVAAELFG